MAIETQFKKIINFMLQRSYFDAAKDDTKGQRTDGDYQQQQH
jgi:hypothetical protein